MHHHKREVSIPNPNVKMLKDSELVLSIYNPDYEKCRDQIYTL